METGQLTIQKSNNRLSQNNIKELSIQISLSGLSFCILNRTSNTIELLQHQDFNKKLTPFDVLERLKKQLEHNSDFNYAFKSVLIIYQNELSTLVPKALFNEDNCADYLKFNAKILKTDFISHEVIAVNDSVNVYVPLVNINNYIFEKFGAFEYKHSSTLLIDTLLQKATQEGASYYINVCQNHFEIIVVENGKLLLYNTFEYKTKEDFIYFVLFTVEQLKSDPETLQLYFSGQITEDSELYTIAYTYIRHIQFIDPKHTFKFAAQSKPNHNYNHFIILNSFS